MTEATARDFGWIEKIARVDDEITLHEFFETIKIELAKFVPLCREDERVRSLCRGVGI